MRGDEWEQLSFYQPSPLAQDIAVFHMQRSLRVVRLYKLYSCRREGHKEDPPLQKEKA